MAFLPVYRSWMEKHLNSRSGERERRLAEGHGHAEKLFLEKVWYPAFGEFENLHPEYEVADFRDGRAFWILLLSGFPCGWQSKSMDAAHIQAKQAVGNFPIR
ncbi:hypothetical protein ACFOLF_28745 [Paenibacillus sepulcri]|uniref:Uncharacterized protein n=1 Tax=Paenibacillus sepulcri TaxID=359917 RepID=A0ABS7C234_9BACL|nr:hypothetical protein [Paenibacillus sepulcri]